VCLPQSSQCPLLERSDIDCPQPWDDAVNETTYYTLGIDEFTILIQHSFRGIPWDLDGASSLKLGGSLRGKDGRTTVFAPNAIGDIISVNDLLVAAGVDMRERRSDRKQEEHSLRHVGIVLLIEVQYESLSLTYPYTYKYEYKVNEVRTDFGYKVVETATGPDLTTRRLIDRHGVKLVFRFEGPLMQFDVFVLLTQLVTSLGLLSVANLIVDNVMVRLMPRSKIYADYKYDTTVDFSDVTDLEEDISRFTILSDDGAARNVQRDVFRMSELRRTGSNNAPKFDRESSDGKA
jgi:hypothetical protein